MKMWEIPIHEFRQMERMAICGFIDTASLEEIQEILREIIVCHDVYVNNPEGKELGKLSAVYSPSDHLAVTFTSQENQYQPKQEISNECKRT
jgi:hypothetical protein